MPITHLERSLTAQTKAAEPAFHLLGGQEGVVVEDDRTAEDCKKEVLQKFLFSNLPVKGERVVGKYYEVLRAIFLIIIILHHLLVLPSTLPSKLALTPMVPFSLHIENWGRVPTPEGLKGPAYQHCNTFCFPPCHNKLSKERVGREVKVKIFPSNGKHTI